jgi:transcriptional regulator with XRE-family HTH domain
MPREKHVYTYKFGEELRKLREKQNMKQSDVAEKIERLLQEESRPGDTLPRFRQNRLSNYERGRHVPDPHILKLLAKIYNADRVALLQAVFFETFLTVFEHRELQLQELLWKYLTTGFNILRRKSTATQTGVDVHHLRSFISFAEMHQVLDEPAQIAWEESLRGKLGCFWVALADFKDNAEFFEVVKENIRHGAKYVYFTRDQHGKTDGEFTRFKKRLLASLDAGTVEQRVVFVPLAGEEVRSLRLDFVVANPGDSDQVGYMAIHHQEGKSIFNVRLPDAILTERIRAISDYVIQSKKIPWYKLRKAESTFSIPGKKASRGAKASKARRRRARSNATGR